MQQDRYQLPEHPAGTDQVAMHLYSEQNIDSNVKLNLSRCLVSAIVQLTSAKVLILGARGGLTAQALLPHCSHLDLVEEDGFDILLRQRFEKKREVDYFFGQEGFIGEHHIIAPPAVEGKEVRVINATAFTKEVHPRYDLVVLQNCIINEDVNLVKELIKVEHDHLLTMLVPGYILEKPFFPFVCTLEKNILSQYYTKVFQEQIQSRKAITGRRNEIFYYEVFGWKRESNDSEIQQKIRTILDQSQCLAKPPPQPKPSHSNPYQTQALVDVYLNFHYGPDCLGVENYPAYCAKVCIDKAKENNLNGRALDLGCAVGRTSIDLASHFKQVIGIDFSAAFIEASKKRVQQHEKDLVQRVKFRVGDACNLNPTLGKFDVIFGGNLIDRVPDPTAFLSSIGKFLEPKGLLVLTSPYSWLQQYTKKEKWIGGYIENGKPVTTNEGIARVLTKIGFKELCPSQDIRFTIKDNEWVYQWTLAWATYWIKTD